jgi:hypothetical protein
MGDTICETAIDGRIILKCILEGSLSGGLVAKQ